jgi:hypothetical protein
MVRLLSKNDLIEKAGSLLGAYYGEYTAEIYTQYYKSKSEEEILKSVSSLLCELLGEDKARQSLKVLYF